MNAGVATAEREAPGAEAGRPGSGAGLRRRLQGALFEPVDIASLVFFRVAFGGILFIEVLRYLYHGWIDRYWTEPSFFFTFYGFDWVQPLGGNGMYLLFLALGVLALQICAGLVYRLATVLFFVGFAYVFLLDKSNYLNHFHLIALISLLMIFIPAHRSFSLDAMVRPEVRASTVPGWTLWLLRGQIALVYFFGGVAKLNGDWLRGQPLEAWLPDATDTVLVGGLLDEPWAGSFFSYGGLMLDLLVAPLLLWRRTRPFAFAAALSFHLLNTQLFSIGIFPWFMIAATTLFFDPDWPRRVVAKVRRRAVRTPKPSHPPSAPRRLIVGLLVVYFAVQILVPLRHVVYPGRVHWTEEGHRFSWHMKLRDKQAEDWRFVVDAAGQRREVDPASYLSERQLDKMLTRPDMILQFAHHVADSERKRGRGQVAVHAWVRVALNDRPAHLLVDPKTDLAAVDRSLSHADWILPLPEDRDNDPSSDLSARQSVSGSSTASRGGRK